MNRRIRKKAAKRRLEEAIRRLQEGAGTQFDPAVVEAMVKAEHAKN